MGQSLVMLGVLGLLIFLLGLLVGLRLADLLARPLRRLLDVVRALQPEQFAESGPRVTGKAIQAAVDHLWAIGRTLTARERELAAQNLAWQRRYSQARALIDLTAEFTQSMQLGIVLERLSQGLSRFFAGDGVGIWIQGSHGDLELAAALEEHFPEALRIRDRWVQQVLADDRTPLIPPWPSHEGPWIAAPLLDALGQKIGIVALTSRRRSAYTIEDGVFLRTVLGHASMAIRNAAMYEFVDALSRIDGLTGLYNRREFDRVVSQELDRAQASGQVISLLVIDIDHFKQINDTHGHQQGDQALKQLARLVQQVPRRIGDAAFRIGGEEFAVLLTETEKPAAFASAEALRSAAERLTLLDDDTRLTVSVGIAAFPVDGRDSATLVMAADGALYRAKAAGRNQVQAA